MEILPIFGQHVTISENIRVQGTLISTIATTSYKNCFQCTGVPFTELINGNVLSFATNISVAPLKRYLIDPAASVPSFILCIAKFIDEPIDAAHTHTWQKIYNLNLKQSNDSILTTFDYSTELENYYSQIYP